MALQDARSVHSGHTFFTNRHARPPVCPRHLLSRLPHLTPGALLLLMQDEDPVRKALEAKRIAAEKARAAKAATKKSQPEDDEEEQPEEEEEEEGGAEEDEDAGESKRASPIRKTVSKGRAASKSKGDSEDEEDEGESHAGPAHVAVFAPRCFTAITPCSHPSSAYCIPCSA